MSLCSYVVNYATQTIKTLKKSIIIKSKINMKQLTMALIAITIMAGLSSCHKEIIGDGPVMTETSTVQSFSAIELQMNGNVYYLNEPNWKVEVSAKQSLLPILQTNVADGKLVIHYNNGKTYDNDETIRITIAG